MEARILTHNIIPEKPVVPSEIKHPRDRVNLSTKWKKGDIFEQVTYANAEEIDRVKYIITADIPVGKDLIANKVIDFVLMNQAPGASGLPAK